MAFLGYMIFTTLQDAENFVNQCNIDNNYPNEGTDCCSTIERKIQVDENGDPIFDSNDESIFDGENCYLYIDERFQNIDPALLKNQQWMLDNYYIF